MSNNKTATVQITSRATGVTRPLSVVWDPEGWEHCSTQRLSDWDDAPVWESDSYGGWDIVTHQCGGCGQNAAPRYVRVVDGGTTSHYGQSKTSYYGQSK